MSDPSSSAASVESSVQTRLTTLFPASCSSSSTPVTVPLSTHVLNTANGLPAENMRIQLQRKISSISSTNSSTNCLIDNCTWEIVATGTTNSDGRYGGFPALSAAINECEYRLIFYTENYFASMNEKCFFPDVTIHWKIIPGMKKLHVPLLVSPFGYSTYRGS